MNMTDKAQRLASNVEAQMLHAERFITISPEECHKRIRGRETSLSKWLAMTPEARREQALLVARKRAVREVYGEATPARVAAPASVPESKPEPAQVVARYTVLCHKCQAELPALTAKPRVAYCKAHEPRQTPRRELVQTPSGTWLTV